ncbi:MAG: phosphatase PAP2 family protein [Pseudomonadota bacterium]
MNYRYFHYNCLFVSLMFLITVIGALITGFELPGFGAFKFPFVVCVVTGAVAWYYTYIRKDENIAHTALGMFSFGLFLKPALMFSYVSLRIGGGKIDEELLAFDKAIGFDWTTLGTQIANYPDLLDWMALAYTSSLHVSVISIFAVGLFFRKSIQVHQFFTAIVISGFICGLCGGFFPIDGIYREGAISLDTMAKINPIMDFEVTKMINELRFGTNLSLNVEDGIGVVGIPSFHTILSFLLVWMARGTGWFFFLSLLWNAAIIFSTPIMGNHYVADVIGGIVASLAAIWMTHKIYNYIDANDNGVEGRSRIFGIALPTTAAARHAEG